MSEEKRRATDLYYSMFMCECEDVFLSQNKSRAKKQTLIMVDGIIEALNNNRGFTACLIAVDYWVKVRKEVTLL